MQKIKYIVLFSIIFLLILYQLFLSFNLIPYFITGQDIIVLIFLFLSVLLFFMSNSIEKLSNKLSATPKETNVSMSISPVQAPDFEITKISEEKDICKYFLAMQNYLQSFTDMKELIDKLLVSTAKITHSQRASILLYNSKNNELYIYRTMGWSNNEIKLLKGTKIRPGEGIAGRVYLDGKPVVMNDTEKRGDIELKDKYKSNSFVSFPVFSGGTIIGVLNLTEKENGVYSKLDLNLVDFITNEVAVHFHYISMLTKEKL